MLTNTCIVEICLTPLTTLATATRVLQHPTVPIDKYDCNIRACDEDLVFGYVTRNRCVDNYLSNVGHTDSLTSFFCSMMLPFYKSSDDTFSTMQK